MRLVQPLVAELRPKYAASDMNVRNYAQARRRPFSEIQNSGNATQGKANKKAFAKGEQAYKAWKQKNAGKLRCNTNAPVALGGSSLKRTGASASQTCSPRQNSLQQPSRESEESRTQQQVNADMLLQPAQLAVFVSRWWQDTRLQATAAASAGMLPMALQLASKLAQLACPAAAPAVPSQPSEQLLVEHPSPSQHQAAQESEASQVLTSPWAWTVKLPWWPISLTVGLSLGDGQHATPQQQQNTQAAQQQVAERHGHEQTVDPIAFTDSNPLFEDEESETSAQLPIHSASVATVAVSSIARDVPCEATQPSEKEPDQQEREILPAELQTGTASIDTQSINAAALRHSFEEALLRRQGVHDGPTKQQRTAFRERHGTTPHTWRLDPVTLRWEPVLLHPVQQAPAREAACAAGIPACDDTEASSLYAVAVGDLATVVAERDRLQQQLNELISKVTTRQAGDSAAGCMEEIVQLTTPQHTRPETPPSQCPVSPAPSVAATPRRMLAVTSPCASEHAMSSLATSPYAAAPGGLEGHVKQVPVPTDSGKKLSFFDNNLFLEVEEIEDDQTQASPTTGEISCMTTPIAMQLNRPWSESECSIGQVGSADQLSGMHKARAGAVSNKETAQADDDDACSEEVDEDWGLYANTPLAQLKHAKGTGSMMLQEGTDLADTTLLT